VIRASINSVPSPKNEVTSGQSEERRACFCAADPLQLPRGNNVALPLGHAPEGCSQDLVNIGVTSAQAPAFQPDSLWSYELGVKSSFLDRRFTANAAGFIVEWDNIQQLISLPLCGYSFTGNSSKARSAGFEFEFNGHLLPELTLGLGVGGAPPGL
jgi:iron complex outermembrane recepter protein